MELSLEKNVKKQVGQALKFETYRSIQNGVPLYNNEGEQFLDQRKLGLFLTRG